MHDDIRRYIQLLESSMKELLNEGRHDDLIKQFVVSARKRYADNQEFLNIIDRGEQAWQKARKDERFSRLPNKWKVLIADATKSFIINDMLDTSRDDVDPKIAKKLSVQTKNVATTRSIFLYLHWLDQYASIDYAPMQEFDPMSVNDPLGRMQELEQLSKTQGKEMIEPTGEETIILDLGKYKWFDLGKSQCDAEGTAMGHCGNEATPTAGDTIYSLRRVISKGDQVYHRPSLTFIVNDGVLGEMKGRANTTPKAEYHPYIMELLKSKYIKSVFGGGYQPENNFSIDDLTDDQRQELIDVKGEEFMMPLTHESIKNTLLSDHAKINASMKKMIEKTHPSVIDHEYLESSHLAMRFLQYFGDVVNPKSKARLEKAVMHSPKWAYLYAKEVAGKHEDVEHALKKYPKFAYLYMLNVSETMRYGLDAIRDNPLYLYLYAKNIKGGRLEYDLEGSLPSNEKVYDAYITNIVVPSGDFTGLPFDYINKNGTDDQKKQAWFNAIETRKDNFLYMVFQMSNSDLTDGSKDEILEAMKVIHSNDYPIDVIEHYVDLYVAEYN